MVENAYFGALHDFRTSFSRDYEYEKFRCLSRKMSFTYKISVKLTGEFTIGKSKTPSSNDPFVREDFAKDWSSRDCFKREWILWVDNPEVNLREALNNCYEGDFVTEILLSRRDSMFSVFRMGLVASGRRLCDIDRVYRNLRRIFNMWESIQTLFSNVVSRLRVVLRTFMSQTNNFQFTYLKTITMNFLWMKLFGTCRSKYDRKDDQM